MHIRRFGVVGVVIALGGLLSSCDDSGPKPAAEAPAASAAAKGSASAVPSAAAPPASGTRSPAVRASAASRAGPARGQETAEPKKRSKRKRSDSSGTSTTVRLLDPGAEPREKLRYELAKGNRQTVDVTMGSSMTLEIAGAKNPTQAMPDVKMTMDIDVVDDKSDGSVLRKMTLSAVALADPTEADSPVAIQVLRQMRGMIGLEGRDRMTDRGIVVDARVDASKVKDGQLKGLMSTTQQTLAQMGVAFPEQAVGAGAKWEAKTKVAQFGVKLTQLATYELLERSGETGKMKVKLDQSAPRGKIAVPGVAEDASELVSMSSKGTGSIEFDLGKSVPKGRLGMKIRAHARGELRGRMTDIVTYMTYDAKFSPR